MLSYTAQHQGNFEDAVDALHAKTLGPAESWRENVDPEWKINKGIGLSGPILRLRRTRGGAVQRSTYAGLVTSGGRMAKWVQLDTQQQLEEIALLLLLWARR